MSRSREEKQRRRERLGAEVDEAGADVSNHGRVSASESRAKDSTIAKEPAQEVAPSTKGCEDDAPPAYEIA